MTKPQIKKPKTTKIGKWTIESGIPIPSRREDKYPFRQMNVGDSFYIADAKMVASVRVYATTFARQNKGFKFTTAAEGKGIRIWRIALNGK